MSHSSTVASEQLNYGFLLLSHIICANKQANSEELKYLKELGDRSFISQQTTDEINKILTKKSQHFTVDYITNKIGLEQLSRVMQQILATFYDQSLFGYSETAAIDRIASVCNWSQKRINRIIK